MFFHAQKKLYAIRYTLYAQTGFSLVEIIIVIAIGAFVTLALGELTVQGYKSYRVTTEQTTQVALARRAQDTIVKELREAVVSDRGDYALVKTEVDALTFFSDVDKDAARERIRYWRDGARVQRGVVEPSGDPPQYRDSDERVRTIARYLVGTHPLFRYYTNDGTELTPSIDLTKVTRIGITFAIDVAPGRSPRAIDIATEVQLRNIKANLEE